MIRLTLLGQAASKANSRRLVNFGRRPALIKSDAALEFAFDAQRQIPAHCRQRLEGDVAVTLHMHYRSERPDLDESVVLDVLQDQFKTVTLMGQKQRVLLAAGVYRNDRQVREKHVFFHVDRNNPRVEIEVAPIESRQLTMPTNRREEPCET